MSRFLGQFALALCVWSCAQWAAAEETPEQRFAAAAKHYRAGQWNQACDGFAALVKKFPEHERSLTAQFYWGEALMQLDQLVEARTHYQLFLDRSRDHKLHKQALFRSGEAAWLSSNDQAACADLEQFQKRYPDDPLNQFALPYLGALRFEAGDHRAAAEYYRMAVEAFPKGELAGHSHVALGRCHEKLDQFESATSIYQRLIESGDVNYRPTALYRLGLIEVQSKNFAQARLRFQEVAEQHPDHAVAEKAKLRLGHVFIELGNWDQAIATLRPLVDQTQVGVEACYWSAIAHKEKQSWHEAIDLLVPAAPEHGDHRLAPAIYFELCDALAAAENLERAIEISRAIAERWPESPYAAEAEAAIGERTTRQSKSLLKLAGQQAQAANYDEALKTLDQVLLSAEPKVLAESQYLRGQILERQGRFDAALAALHAAINSQPAGQIANSARHRAARLHEQLNQVAEATELYEAISAGANPAADEALYRLGVLAQGAANPSVAVEHWQQLGNRHPQSPFLADALFGRAKIAITKNEYDEAARLLAEASSRSPSAATHQRILFQQGKLAVGQSRWKEVAQPLELLCNQYPESPLRFTARYWIAEASYQQRDYAKAAEEFTALEELALDRSDAWLPSIPLRKAQALAQQKKWFDALQVGQQTVERYPEFDDLHEVHYLVGRCHAAIAEFDAARMAYQRVLVSSTAQGTETAAIAQFMIGETYFHQEDHASALRAYRKVDGHQFAPWQAAALLQAGKVCEQLKRSSDATQCYAAVLKRFPDSKVADEARRRLETATQNDRSSKRT